MATLAEIREEIKKKYPSSGKVSYYTNKSVDPRWGGVTKSGEKFDENKLTAAILPEYWKEFKGKTFRVTNPTNNKSVEVKINDTGGFGKYGRILDLSHSAFQAIADPKQGIENFNIEFIEEKKEKPKEKPRSQLNLNPFAVTEAQTAEEPTETTYLHRKRIDEIWQSIPDNRARIRQIWEETPSTPITERAKELWEKPSLPKQVLQETTAQLQDILTMPARLIGTPHPPMVSKLATETVPSLPEELFKPRATIPFPSITLRGIEQGYIEPSIADVGLAAFYGSQALGGIKQTLEYNQALRQFLGPYAAEAQQKWKAGAIPTTAEVIPTTEELLKKPAITAPSGIEQTQGVTEAPIMAPSPIVTPTVGVPEVPSITQPSPIPLAIRLNTGRVISDPTVNLHSDIITKQNINPDDVRDVGIIEQKPIPKELQSLAEEAKKYKNVEEFIVSYKGSLNVGDKIFINSQAQENYLRKIYKEIEGTYIPTKLPDEKGGAPLTWEVGQERKFAFDPNSTKNEGRFRLYPNYQQLKKALKLLEDSPVAQSLYQKLGTNQDEIRVVIDKVEAGAVLNVDEQAVFDTFSKVNLDILKKEIVVYERKIQQLTAEAQKARTGNAGGADQPAIERTVSHAKEHEQNEAAVEGSRGNSLQRLFNEGQITLNQINSYIDRTIAQKWNWLKTILQQDAGISQEDLKQDIFTKLWEMKRPYKGKIPVEKWLGQQIDFIAKNILLENSSPDKSRYTNAQMIAYRKIYDAIIQEGRQPTIEEFMRRIPDNTGHPGITLERAKYIEWMANVKKISLDALKEEGIELQAPPGIIEIDINTRIKDMIFSSFSMQEAQQRLKKELNLDFTIVELKNLEIQIKGGTLPNLANKIVQDAVDKILAREPNADAKYGFFKILGVDEKEVAEGISVGEKIKEATFETWKKLTHAINSLELAQNYLYSFPDTKPIAQSIIDNNTKLLKTLFELEQFYTISQDIENPEVLAKILVDADRDNTVNIFAELHNAIKKGKITQRDYDAFAKGLYFMRKYIKNTLIQDILDSHLGIRIRSRGKRYNVSYTRKDKQTSQRWVTGIQLDQLKERFGSINILEEKEMVSFRHVDPATGKYITKNALVNDYEEALKLATTETKALIKELLPYENWLPHARRRGNWWIEIYEPLAEGVKETKIYSARVSSQAYAEQMAEIAKKRFPSARIIVHPHNNKMRLMPSFGTMADVQFFLNQNGIDPKSEAGQRIINAYRAMSPLLSTLIHSQNLAGWRTDYEGILENMYLMAKSAAHRSFRLELKDLKDLLKNVQDDFRYNTAFKYLEALKMTGERHVLLESSKAMTYFLLLANKPTYIVQNLTEPLWGLTAAIPQMKNPLSLIKPLNKEYIALVKKAQKEGLLKSFFIENFTGQGTLARLDFFGRASERFSSRKVFEIGLKVARDKRLTGEEAYRFAYQFLFNEGKPFYSQANAPIGTLGPDWQAFRQHGFILMKWWEWWINKFFRGNIRNKILMILGAFLLAGVNTIPFGKRIIKKTGLINLNKRPRDFTFGEKLVLAGLPAAVLNMSTRFLAPTIGGPKTLGLEIFRSISILTNKIQQANTAYRNYGLIGAIASLPLAGLQYPLMGKIISEQGLKRSRKVIYRPRTLREKILLQGGLTPLEMEMARQKKLK